MLHFYIMTAPDDKNINPISSNNSDFSIDHILNRAGNTPPIYKSEFNNLNSDIGSSSRSDIYPWLQCTRYCPPKILSISNNKIYMYIFFIWNFYRNPKKGGPS